MKRLTKVICALLAVFVCSVFAKASAPTLTAETAVLIDADTGQVLYNKNMHERMFPASITKVITVITGLEKLDVSDTITLSHYAVFSLPVGSSHIALDEGETITVEQAVHAALMMSANDACNGIAEAASGSIENFTVEMNELARRAGALNSTFINAHGISEEGHLTTAYDMAMICRYALRNETFREVFGKYKYTMPPNNKKTEERPFVNQHYMISNPDFKYEGVIGGKTGWTTDSKHTLVTAAQRDGRTLIAVVMKCPKNEDKYNDTAALFDYGFSNFKSLPVTGESFPKNSGYTLSEPVFLLVDPEVTLSDISFEFYEEEGGAVATAFFPNGEEVLSFPCEPVPEALPVMVEEDEPFIVSLLMALLALFLLLVGLFALLVLVLYIRKEIYRARRRRRRRRRR